MNAHDRARVAVKAQVSTRSVERYLRGLTMRPSIEARIVAAFGALRMANPRPAAGANQAPAAGG
jgi:hypothetical protein